MTIEEIKEKIEKLENERTEVMHEYHYTDAYNTMERCRKKLDELNIEIAELNRQLEEHNKKIDDLEHDKKAVNDFLQHELECYESGITDDYIEWIECIKHLIQMNNIRKIEED